MAAVRPNLAAYRHVVPLTTRWMDNDIYGHINNVAYYSFFDTAANHYLIHEGGLDPHTAAVIGLVVESRCTYHAPLSYPDPIRVALRVDRLGNRAVTYGLAIFAGAHGTPDQLAAAHGDFAHVFVDRVTRTPTAIPPAIRSALEKLVVAG
jgi:acyl-CoA thioester hydrolase